MKKFVYLSVLMTLTTGFLLNFYFNAKSPVFSGSANSYEVYLSNGSFGDIVGLKEREFYFTNGIRGESFVAGKDFDTETLIKDLNAKPVFIETTEFGTSYYFYSSKLKYQEIIDGKRINLHVFESESGVKIGSPIIYGSF